jgi:glucose/arabinose dehydrogenase
MEKLVIVLFSTFLLTACSSNTEVVPPIHSGNQAQTFSSKANNSENYDIIAEQLISPWAVDFSKDAIYISERNGNVVKIKDGKQLRQQLHLSKPVKQEGEGGFLGFVLAPDYETSKQAYAYYMCKENDRLLNRIVLLQEKADAWDEVRLILDDIQGWFYHNGGRLAIGPDQHLYATIGDALEGDKAQDKNSLNGKILRMNLDGSIPADNPFPGSYVYTYGHRNPQGIAWDKRGNMYATEHGPSAEIRAHDEINFIKPGRNYGWPLVIGDETKDGLTPPLFHTGDYTLAPSGLAVTEKGELLIAGLQGEQLAKLVPGEHSIATILYHEGRLRDVKFHDGSVYVLTNNTDGRGTPKQGDDRLLRLKTLDNSK